MKVPDTLSGIRDETHLPTKQPHGNEDKSEAGNIQSTKEERRYTLNEKGQIEHEALLLRMCKDERYRRSIVPKILKNLGKGGKLTYETGKAALSYSGNLAKSILPHYLTEGGAFKEFVDENIKLNKTLLVEPISSILKNKEKIQALIGDLKAGHLTDYEAKSLYESISKHQDTCLKYPNETLDHVDKRYESCRAARDRIKSLIDKYESKFADSHLLRGLYKVHDEEFKVLEQNREKLQDRKKIWDKSQEGRISADNAVQQARGYFEDFGTESDPAKKEKLRQNQQKYFIETYQKRYDLVKESMLEQIKFLLEAMERKKSKSPDIYHKLIESNTIKEITRLRMGLKVDMANLGIESEPELTVNYLDVQGNTQNFTVSAVELEENDPAFGKSIRIPEIKNPTPQPESTAGPQNAVSGSEVRETSTTEEQVKSQIYDSISDLTALHEAFLQNNQGDSEKNNLISKANEVYEQFQKSIIQGTKSSLIIFVFKLAYVLKYKYSQNDRYDLNAGSHLKDLVDYYNKLTDDEKSKLPKEIEKIWAIKRTV